MSEVPETKNRLRDAVNSVDMPPYLETRIRAQIRATERSRGWGFLNMKSLASAAAVGATVAVGLTIAYQLGHLRLTRGSQESYIATVTNQVATLMRVGLGDHIHCSVFRKYPKNAPKVEDLESKLGPKYEKLIPIVQKNVAPDYRMMLAHECGYHGRKFIHLSLMNDSQMLSLIATRKKDGESFKTEGLLPALIQSDIPMYKSDAQRFQITAFETDGYLLYFISDLPAGENTRIMTAMGGELKSFFASL